MSKHTSFKIGGPADLFVYINNQANLLNILNLLKLYNINYFILGNGSNLLVSDTGYRGVVLKLVEEFENINLESKSEEKNIINCGSGISLSKACIFAMKNNLSGLEFAYGIPGTFGGALFMNAGAYGGEISDIILEATHINPTQEKIETLKKHDMNLSYRKSLYINNNFVITSAKILLNKDKKENIEARMKDIISRRKEKQPLEYPSAGSVFKRPENHYAAALIESCGLKGTSVGGAMVSTKHSGFIINHNKALAQDVCELIKIIKNKIYKQHKILLECEIKTLGDINI